MGALLAHGWTRVRRGTVFATALGLAALPLVAAILPDRLGSVKDPPRVAAATSPRLLVIGVDGFDPDLVESMIRRGQLSRLASLMRNGSYGRLATLTPTYSPPIWTTIATGRMPDAHG